MISVELWRARIGTFNSKSCSSGSFSSNSSFFHCFTNKDVQSQEDDSTLDSTWPTAQKRPYSIAASTVALSSRLCSSSEPGEKHTATNFSAEHGFLSGISIKQLHSPSHFTYSYSSSSSSAECSRDSVFQYHSPQLKDVLIVMLTVLVIALISQLLIISGDIETNPGPMRGGEQDDYHRTICTPQYYGNDIYTLYPQLMINQILMIYCTCHTLVRMVKISTSDSWIKLSHIGGDWLLL